MDDCRRSFTGRSSRPASASAQLLRQSLGALESAAGSAAAVKALAAQAEGLATALAAAARDAADAKEDHARNLAGLEASLAAAEAAAATCWRAYDVTFTEVAKRVASLLQSQCEGLVVPYHRPRPASARNAAATRPRSRPVSAAAAAAGPGAGAAADCGADQLLHCPADGSGVCRAGSGAARCSPSRRPVSATSGLQQTGSPVHGNAELPNPSAACSSRPQSAAAGTSACSWAWGEVTAKQQTGSRPGSALQCRRRSSLQCSKRCRHTRGRCCLPCCCLRQLAAAAVAGLQLAAAGWLLHCPQLIST
ncbi:hypothetical protein COO60DRAFT_594359 [Scenedesmus sp. NREL 46B-D3]|nr:hypothetical protein COO60DRAFT_594359 [Scenedesmus sp. NREL 46B-D3]